MASNDQEILTEADIAEVINQAINGQIEVKETASPSAPTSIHESDESSIQKPAKSGRTPVRGVSDRLLMPTKSNIADQQKLQELKHEAEVEARDSMNVPVARNPKYENVQSKLFSPTTAYTVSKASKYVERDHEVETEAKKAPRNVEISPTLLQPTEAVKNAVYRRKDEEESKPEKVEITPARRLSLQSGPDVSSRLFDKTKAAETARWKSKAEIEAEELASLEAEKAARTSERKVKQPSAHILELTAGMENARYQKPGTGGNPKEQGWKSIGGTAASPLERQASSQSKLDSPDAVGKYAHTRLESILHFIL